MEARKGNLPPQAIDLEEAVLGAIMIDKGGLFEVMELLRPEYFYKPEHQFIYTAITTLFNESQPIDLLTVANQLRKIGKLENIGGDPYLIELTQKVSSSAHIEFHARVIQEKYALRIIIENANKVIKKAYDDETDVFKLLDDSYDFLLQTNSLTDTNVSDDFKDVVMNQVKKARDIYDKKIPPGLPIPLKKLNKLLGGWKDTDLIILAARPGMGKTSLMLAYALHLAKAGEPIAIFSLEMSREQLVNKLISMETGIPLEKLNKTGLSGEDILEHGRTIDELRSYPIFIDDTPALSPNRLKVKAKKIMAKHDIKMIFVDYLQIMDAKERGRSREQEVSIFSGGLKALAKELNVPVLALSQLSRSVETRGGIKRPMLSDLRDSGAIEQDADIVNFIYRPEYYNMEFWDDDDRTPCENQAEIITAKNRNGSLDTIRVTFEKKTTHFKDLEITEQAPPTYSPSNVFGDIEGAF